VGSLPATPETTEEANTVAVLASAHTTSDLVRVETGFLESTTMTPLVANTVLSDTIGLSRTMSVRFQLRPVASTAEVSTILHFTAGDFVSGTGACRYADGTSFTRAAFAASVTFETVGECKAKCREITNCVAFDVIVDALPTTCNFYAIAGSNVYAAASAWGGHTCFIKSDDWGYVWPLC
jgi:hypothetical protein